MNGFNNGTDDLSHITHPASTSVFTKTNISWISLLENGTSLEISFLGKKLNSTDGYPQ